MTLSRRDTLKVAAALAATRGAVFAVSPQDAVAMLAAPAGDDFTVVDDPFRMTATAMDPVTFADYMSGLRKRWSGETVGG